MKTIPLGLLATLGIFVAGCKDEPPKDVRACIDKQNHVVDDSFCEKQAQTSSGTNQADDQTIRNLLLYRWAFGGNYSGGSVNGYMVHPAVGYSYVSPRSPLGTSIVSAGGYDGYVSRGGFGGSFTGAHAEGEGGGE